MGVALYTKDHGCNIRCVFIGVGGVGVTSVGHTDIDQCIFNSAENGCWNAELYALKREPRPKAEQETWWCTSSCLPITTHMRSKCFSEQTIKVPTQDNAYKVLSRYINYKEYYNLLLFITECYFLKPLSTHLKHYIFIISSSILLLLLLSPIVYRVYLI